MSLDNQRDHKKPVLSIIILSYNTKQITQDCIESIYRSNPSVPFEIIIVDNASTDGSVETLQEFQKTRKNLKIITNKENIGFAKGNNQGVNMAKGEYILLLNSDIIVLDEAINNLFTYYKQHKGDVHFVGGKLLNADKTAQPSCGPFYTLPVVVGALFLRGDYWGLTRYSPDETKRVDWVSGACIFTKKEYFQKLNGFDEKIFMYMEEIDLLYRAKNQGFRTHFYPEARFIHLGSASSGGKTYPILQVYKGFLFFYHKHYPLWMTNMLKYILRLKALIAIAIGRVTNNHYLKTTYEQAYKITTMD